MSRTHAEHLLEPYRDPSGLGFSLNLHRPGCWPARRQLTLVAVCWNFAEDRALFINAAGLVVPSWHNRDVLAKLLRSRTLRQEFGRVIGDGQFAIKSAELKAIENSGRIKPWLVHYLDTPASYLDDSSAWAAYVECDLQAERDAFARSNEAVAELRRRGVAFAQHSAGDTYDAELRQVLERRRAEIDSRRTKDLADEARIAAWLRGDVGGPPLLAMMQGAA